MDDRLVAANQIVQKKVWWSLAGGLVPIPWVDAAAVTGVQLSMIYALSNNYDVEFKKDISRNCIASLLGSVVPESLAYGTVGSGLKMIPVLGQTFGGITMSAFSGAATYAIGKVFIQHFETGGTFLNFDSEGSKEYFKQLYAEGKEKVKNLKKSKPEADEPEEEAKDLEAEVVEPVVEDAKPVTKDKAKVVEPVKSKPTPIKKK